MQKFASKHAQVAHRLAQLEATSPKRPGQGLLSLFGLTGQEATNRPYLDNKLNLLSIYDLVPVESAITAATMPQAFLRVANRETWGLKEWRLIHRIIFEPIYPWAGTIRDVNIAKDNTIFLDKRKIVKAATAVFEEFHKKHSKRNSLQAGLSLLTQDQLAASLAMLYHDLNRVHAFREGNGRSMRTLCAAIARQIGYDFDWESLNREKLKPEFDAACSIEKNNGGYQRLIILFKRAIKPYDQNANAARHSATRRTSITRPVPT